MAFSLSLGIGTIVVPNGKITILEIDVYDLDRFATSYDSVESYPNPEKRNEDKNQNAREVKVVLKMGIKSAH